MVFPSGEEVRVSTRTVKPADGATSSLSIESNKAVCWASAASAAGVFSCASNSSRLETFGFSAGRHGGEEFLDAGIKTGISFDLRRRAGLRRCALSGKLRRIQR
jgi:hypothetical protein